MGAESFARAKIIILDKPDQPAIEVMFNPTEYSFSKDAKYNSKLQGQPQFLGFEFQPFAVSLFYDTYESGTDVRKKYIDQITALTEPSVSGQQTMRPPECIFSWGSFALRGVVQKVEQKFTMFLADGTPVRVLITITFNPTAIDKEVEKLKGREACRKIWTVKSGDRLDLIAYRALKDPGLWPMIAGLNGIVNPLEFPREADIGSQLIIPDLAGRDTISI